MPHLLWDASALAKRYTEELGSPTVQVLFDVVSRSQMITTIWGYAESFSILMCRHNSGVISASAFTKAASALENEFIFDPDPTVLSIDDTAILSGIAIMRKHNRNATDAAILVIFMRYVAASGLTAVALVSADKRLLRAAQSEGLAVINPEAIAAAEVPALIASL